MHFVLLQHPNMACVDRANQWLHQWKGPNESNVSTRKTVLKLDTISNLGGSEMFLWLSPIFHWHTGNEAVLRTCKLEFALIISWLLAIVDMFSDTACYTPASIPRRWIIFSVNRYNRLASWKKSEKHNLDKKNNSQYSAFTRAWRCEYSSWIHIFHWAQGNVLQ